MRGILAQTDIIEGLHSTIWVLRTLNPSGYTGPSYQRAWVLDKAAII